MCGIGGIININPAKRNFDYQTFCTLGISNDLRGGDSCGVFIDGRVEYGTGQDKKYFENFFLESKVINDTVESDIALVHCRKASVGSISEKTAQPVVLKSTKTNEIRFVMLHNGTIYNYEDLAKKYIPDIDIKGMTDSQVMARIFYYKGYDCLSEYNGGSVFFIVDYRQPKPEILIFKGQSKKSESSKEATEERPFWFVEDENGMIFSSISSYLYAARRGGTIYTVRANSLIRYEGIKDKDSTSGLVVVKDYPRDDCYQTKKYASYSSGSYYGRYVDGYWSGVTDDYAGYYGGKGRTGGGYTMGNFHTKESDVSSAGKQKESRGSITTYSDKKFIKEDTTNNTYYIGFNHEEIAHGALELTKYGRIIGKDDKDVNKFDTRTVYFFHGIALRKKEYFKFLEYLRKRSKLDEETFIKKYENLVRFFSTDRLYFKAGVLVKATSLKNYEIYSGIWHPIGTTIAYRFENGKDIRTRVTEDAEIPFKCLTTSDGIILSKIQKECKSLMK